MDLKCFWKKETGELIFIPDSMSHPLMDEEIWSDDLKKIEHNPESYTEIEPLKPFKSFEIMENFASTLSDSNALKSKLVGALNRKKPFREFKFVIDNSDEYRQKWFDFKKETLNQLVPHRVEAIENE